MPEPRHLRPATWEDAPGVLAVLVARHTADLGIPLFRIEEVLDEWRAPDLRLDEDAAVIEVDGTIAAYAIVHRPGAFAVVSPAHEGVGVGTRLPAWVQQRERERHCDVHRQIAASTNARAHDLLERAGYRQVRSYWRMARPLHHRIEAATVPAGITLRSLNPDADARALHALDAQSFGSSPDYVPESLEMFISEHLQTHDVAPELSLVAQEGDAIVGFLLARLWRHEATGYVDLLAVAPDRQRRGIGTALLTHGFAAFARAGLVQAQLGVASDNLRGLRVYEAAGMAQRFRFDVFERPVK